MRKIANEKVHSKRISTDNWVDCERSKQFFDYFTRHQKFVGYLQKIEINPYAILCLSQIQVCCKLKYKIFVFLILKYLSSNIKLDFWQKTEKINPVWFFDATGNIHKQIPGNTTPLFYSIVCHDYVRFNAHFLLLIILLNSFL